MNWKGSSQKTVFILGAGATRGAFSHVLINRKRIRAPLNGDFFQVVESFVKAHGTDSNFGAMYKRIRNVFREEFPTRGRWPIPMEEAFSLLFVSKDFPEIYVRRGRRRKAGTRREIEDFLRLTFGILAAIEAQVTQQNLYMKLVSHLGADDTIITLNYDTLLDSALVRAGWNPAEGYGLMGAKSKISWTRQKPALSPLLANVRLLKLHGSLNWYVRGTVAKLTRVFEAKPTKVIISERPRTNEHSGLVRQIVPPIYGKFFAHKHWRTLWNAAHQALVEADALVIIGCSLTDSDFHLSGMLSHAINERKAAENPFSLVAAVDKTKVRRKWFDLLRGCAKSTLPYRSFAKFADENLRYGE